MQDNGLITRYLSIYFLDTVGDWQVEWILNYDLC